MTGKLKFNTVLVFLLAVLFCLFFELSKHDPFLLNANAFAEDPYDGIGSMGIQAAVILAALSLLRAFWPSPKNDAFENRKALLVRTQMMAILAVSITLTADAIAMLRHPSMWVGSAGGHLLAALLAGMAFLTAMAGLAMYRSGRGIALPKISNARSRAIAVSFAAIFILALYPESWRHGILGALFTALIGAVLLFVPMWALERALIPYREEINDGDPATIAWSYLRNHHWIFIVLAGVFTGLLMVLRELHQPGGWPQPTGRIFFVVSVYVGLETAGLLIGYSLLRKPLGLFLPRSQQR